MKLIHTGDVHLGSAFKTLTGEQARQRNAELLDGFRRLCTYAKENGVYAVLLAGDLFDGNQIPAQLKKETLSIISAAAPVCFFYVSGNHDEEFSAENLPSNLYLFSDARAFKSYDLPENICVTGLDTKYFAQAAFAQLALPPQKYNILLLHGEKGVDGGASSENIPFARLQNKGIDYLALGHIHKPTLTAERLDGRGVYRYCGCLEGRGFDEVGQRGFFLLEIENGKLVKELFLSVASREVVEVRADISACTTYYDVENCAVQALSAVPSKNMVKLLLTGRHALGLKKDLTLLEGRLGSRFFLFRVVDESRLFIDYRAFENDKTERGEFVREVGRYELNEDLRAEILDVGLKALAGEEIDL